jgi:heptosyltransferase-2
MRVSPPKFLIVGPSWVGDMVMADSLYRLLAEREPEAAIDVVAPAWSVPILARMDHVRHAIELPVAHGELGLAKRHAAGRALRDEGYTHALVLPRSWKSALLPYFAGVPRRTGFRGELRYGLINDVRPYDRGRLVPTVERFATLGLAPGEPVPQALPQPRLRVDPNQRRQTFARLALSDAANAVALLPGAEYGPAKQWPPAYFAELAARLAAVGVDVWILGSAKERELGESIRAAAGSPRVRNFCGDTSLADVVDVLGAARVAVSNDSGLMHVAAAVGTYVVGIFGSSSPQMTPPLTDRRWIFHLALDCSPCFERECPLGHLRCLRDVAVEDVCSVVIRAFGAPPVDRASGTS